MIEVIMKGRPRKYICACPHCHSTLEFAIEDMKKKNDFSTDYYIFCPACGHFINDSYFKEKRIT